MQQTCAVFSATICGDDSGEDLSELACFFVHAAIELPGFLLLTALCEQIFKMLKLSNINPTKGGFAL